jgi:putative tryptophan/tyrosine transport system substrate-binding protein
LRRIAVLMAQAADDPVSQPRAAAFVDRLQELGWNEGKNLSIDLRWDTQDPDLRRKDIAEIVAFSPDAILATGSFTVGPLLQQTRAIPIVFVLVPDPVGSGFVNGLAHPGGNATGFLQLQYSLGGKWLELLKEIAPRVSRVAVLRDQSLTAGVAQFAAIESVAHSLRVELVPVNAQDAGDRARD